jgi:hypothetical protein
MVVLPTFFRYILSMKKVRLFILTLAAMILLSGVASAQYVFLARKALGAVNRLTNHDQGYDVATVLLNADAEKVYRTALKLVSENPKLHLAKRDDSSRTIEFSDGQQVATLRSIFLQADTTQLMVVCSTDQGKAASPSPVVESILRVCRQMNVACELAKD